MGGRGGIEGEPGASIRSKDVLRRQISFKMGASQRDKELT